MLERFSECWRLECASDAKKVLNSKLTFVTDIVTVFLLEHVLIVRRRITLDSSHKADRRSPMLLRATRAILLLLVVLGPSYAQTPSGEISGVVSDSAGSVVSAVRITLTNVATNAVREAETNDAGLYSFPALPPGIYNLRVERQGFRAIERRNIEVLVGSANRIDLTLEIGEVSSVVEIAGGAPVLQSENASIGTVIENRSVVELPLNGRNYLQLTSLIPGATTNGPSSSQGKQRMGGQRNSFALNVSGQRIHFNHYSLDGVEN